MVDNAAKKPDSSPETGVEVNEAPVKWCSVSLSEVVKHGRRLEASVFDVEAKQTYDTISQCPHPKKALIGDDGFVSSAHYGDRLKRNYVSETAPSAIGFIGSAEMLDVYPKPIKFMTDNDTVRDLKVTRNTVLLSRSGTIGNVTLVNRTLEKFLISEHAMRLVCRENPGYVYCFLKSKSGQKLIRSKTYGAVVSQIEPEHIADIPVPDPPAEIKQTINDLILKSYELRDTSNDLIDQAQALLVAELKLPPINQIQTNQLHHNAAVLTFNVKLSELAGRFDASYHVPLVDAIVDILKKNAARVTSIGDKEISSDVVLPGRFKRVYVEEAHGVRFIGGKEMHQLSPATEKYLSRNVHQEQLEGASGIKPYSVLTPARGSLGDVELPCEHFHHWAISDNMMQILSYETICGYLYVFLNSAYGKVLIQRFTYGGVVDAIEPSHIRSVEVPILKNTDVQNQINDLALKAVRMRHEAYQLEQQALKLLDDKVIYAK